MKQYGIRLSVPAWAKQQTLLLWPGQQKISIDCCMAHSSVACGGQMQVVPLCQDT